MIQRLLLPVAVLPSALLLLATALAVPALAGGGCHGGSSTEATEASSSVVKIFECAFAPTIDRVRVGASISFLNTGLGPHDVTGRAGTWGSTMLEPGESWSTRFAAPGVYAYSCSLHPGMAGAIVVELVSPVVATSANVPTEPMTADAAPMTVVAVGAVGLAVGALVGALVGRRRDRGA